MADKNVAYRLAAAYLAQLLEHPEMPELTTTEGHAIPTEAIVERILGIGAFTVERRRVREHGEVLVVTMPVEPVVPAKY